MNHSSPRVGCGSYRSEKAYCATYPPSAREMQALKLLCRGMCNKEIAAEMGCGVEAVKGLLKVVYLKLKVTSRTEALLEAIKRGWAL